MEFQSGQNNQTHSKQLSNRFSSRTIVKCVQNNCPNLIDKTVDELARNQLSNSDTFSSYSNACCQLVQKNCQMQEFSYNAQLINSSWSNIQVHHAQNTYMHYHFVRSANNITCAQFASAMYMHDVM